MNPAAYVEKSSIKHFVAPEEAACNLINCASGDVTQSISQTLFIQHLSIKCNSKFFTHGTVKKTMMGSETDAHKSQ